MHRTSTSSNPLNSFGSIMEGRSYERDTNWRYRFGMNTQERDDEIYGKGNTSFAEFWEYDTRLGRRWNLDPKPVIGISQYACFENNPISFSDIFGDKVDFKGKGSKKAVLIACLFNRTYLKTFIACVIERGYTYTFIAKNGSSNDVTDALKNAEKIFRAPQNGQGSRSKIDEDDDNHGRPMESIFTFDTRRKVEIRLSQQMEDYVEVGKDPIKVDLNFSLSNIDNITVSQTNYNNYKDGNSIKVNNQDVGKDGYIIPNSSTSIKISATHMPTEAEEINRNYGKIGLKFSKDEDYSSAGYKIVATTRPMIIRVNVGILGNYKFNQFKRQNGIGSRTTIHPPKK